MRKYEARLKIVSAALQLEAARLSFELNPGDPYGDASIVLHEDMMDYAIEEYQEAKP